MTRTARLALLAALSFGVAAPALAQTIPPGQTCGGLLCDMGVFGRKVPVNADGSAPTQAQVAAAEAADPHRLPCHDFLCRAFGQKDAEAAPPPPMPVAAAEPEAPAKHARKMKRKHLAKAEPRTPAPAEAAAPATAAK